jgi:ferredoxin
VGVKEDQLCYGISLNPVAWYDYMNLDFFGSPDVAGFEQLTKEEALAHIAESDRQGFVHSVWTFKTPFIGAICNCDKRYCLSMRSTLGLDVPVIFKAEYVASMEADICSGCLACINQCQFSAIDFNDSINACEIDSAKCFGCGVCRPTCPEDAISLRERVLETVMSAVR